MLALAEDPTSTQQNRAVMSLATAEGRKYVSNILRIMQDAKNKDYVRLGAAETLSTFADPVILDALLADATSPDTATRGIAYHALKNYPDPRASRAVVSGLEDKDMINIGKAYDAIISSTIDVYATYLLEMVKRNPPSSIALQVLAARPAQEALDTLLTIANDKNADPVLRYYALIGLAGLDDPTAGEPLLLELSAYDPQAKPQGMLFDNLTRAVSRSRDARSIPALLQVIARLTKANKYEPAFITAMQTLTGIAFKQGQPVDPSTQQPLTTPLLLGIRPAKPAAYDGMGVKAAPFAFGQITPTIFTLLNNSNRAIVVTGIRSLTHQGEEVISLLAADGKSAGLLMPGQAMQVSVPYRTVSLTERFVVSYLPADQPYNGTAASLAPLAVQVGNAGEAGRFVAFDDKAWQAIAAEYVRVTPAEVSKSPRTVLVGGTAKAQECTVPCLAEGVETALTIPLVERMRAVAAKMTGIPGEKLALAYSQALDGYVVAENATTLWLLHGGLTQKERGALLPAFPPLLLKDVDAGTALLRVSETQPAGKDNQPTGKKLWDKFPTSYGDSKALKGEYLALAPADLAAFLKTLTANGSKITQQTDAVGKRSYALEMKR